ncbi:M20 metallopeptidase family protein [Shewanella corallii]|uniref:M20 metallopeptidase family protein n=1 Tax=Shewanella corallii TaxID=560080 RepID=UPI0024B3A5C2|nr:amidohydrolase [Shewanella corallii]
MIFKYFLGTTLALTSSLGLAASPTLDMENDKQFLEQFYRNLHQHPELSFQERQTGNKLAKQLEALGFDVTKEVGGYGVVGLYANGEGPTVMIRADTDALPITEETGKPYASQVKITLPSGQSSGVMHGCGHDIHMTSFIGAARQLIANKDSWQGTLMMVAQPAEEVGAGAKAMLADGLFEKFAKPDHILALHVSANLPAGTVGIKPEYALASVDSVDISVFGKGGHGAYPHTTIDPIVLASRIVLGLQTITSRELSPLEPSVITVGSIHGGTKHNVISNEVKLQLTLRSYNPEVRDAQIAALKRLTAGIAMSAGLTPELYPRVKVHQSESIPSTYNDPAQTAKVRQAIEKAIGMDKVEDTLPVMAGEDFGLFGRTEDKLPITIFWLGAVEPKSYSRAMQSGETLPSLHSSKFAPDYVNAIPTGVKAMTHSAISLFNQQR